MLKWGGSLYPHHFSTHGMSEFQCFGMEAKALVRLTVEGIAHDGTVHAIGVGGMDTELVGAAGLGVVVDEGSPFRRGIAKFIAGNRGFAILEIDELVGAVVVVGTHGEADEAFGGLALRNAFQQCEVAFLDTAALELGLELGMDVLVLGGQEEAGGVHVEAMNQQGTGGVGVPLLQDAEDGGLAGLSRDGEHTGGLVDHEQEFVFIDGVELGGIGVGDEERVGLDIESLQHVAKDGFALVAAGGVVVSVTTDFTFGGVSPPPFGHGQRLQPLQVSMLQELGGGAFTGSGRRVAAGGLGEDLFDVFRFAPGVEQAELAEDPLLEGDGAVLAFFFEGVYILVIQRSFATKNLGCIHVGVIAMRMVLPFGWNLPCGVFSRSFASLWTTRGRRYWMTLLYGVIQCGDAGFFLLEVAVGGQEVIDGRDKEGVVVAAGEVAGEGGQVADAAFVVLYDQYPEHLAVLEFLVPVGAGMEVGLYLFGGQHTEGVRGVVEGVGELLRQGDVDDGGLEGMHVCSNI